MARMPASIDIQAVSVDDAEGLSRLVHESFLHAAATDWSESTVQRFLDESAPGPLPVAIAQSFLACAARCDGQCAGFALMPRAALLGMLFVAPAFQGRGVARQLWEQARAAVEARAPDVRTVELNATPFAQPAYRALGFHPISEPFDIDGCVATRMACWLPARGLARPVERVAKGSGRAASRGGRAGPPHG